MTPALCPLPTTQHPPTTTTITHLPLFTTYPLPTTPIPRTHYYPLPCCPPLSGSLRKSRFAYLYLAASAAYACLAPPHITFDHHHLHLLHILYLLHFSPVSFHLHHSLFWSESVQSADGCIPAYPLFPQSTRNPPFPTSCNSPTHPPINSSVLVSTTQA